MNLSLDRASNDDIHLLPADHLLYYANIMMTSSNGNIFRVTGLLCGEITGPRWIPRTKASDAELWCVFFICVWINGWVNNREVGDLRRYHAHYDVTVMVVTLNNRTVHNSYQHSHESILGSSQQQWRYPPVNDRSPPLLCKHNPLTENKTWWSPDISDTKPNVGSQIAMCTSCRWDHFTDDFLSSMNSVEMGISFSLMDGKRSSASNIYVCLLNSKDCAI